MGLVSVRTCDICHLLLLPSPSVAVEAAQPREPEPVEGILEWDLSLDTLQEVRGVMYGEVSVCSTECHGLVPTSGDNALYIYLHHVTTVTDCHGNMHIFYVHKSSPVVQAHMWY